MIRRLLTTTALATVLATGAMAQTADPMTAPADQALEQEMTIRAEGFLASNLIGETVYSGTGDEAENIGKVNDLVIGPNGEIQAVVIGVGGFLGIGQKDVAIEYDLVEWAERDGDRWMVVPTTAEALKAQPDFDRTAFRPMPADADVAEPRPATAEDLAAADQAQPADDDLAMAPADEPVEQDTAAAPADEQQALTDETRTGAIDRPGMTPRAAADIHADELIGTRVYGANDEHVGDVGDLVLTQDGQVDAVIIDVGGFLGIGEKQVAVGFDDLQFMTDADGGYHLYTNMTQEQLEAQPEYDEATYAERRDDMRMRVTDDRDAQVQPADDQAVEQDTAAAPADEQQAQETETVVVQPTDDDAIEQDTAAAPADQQQALTDDETRTGAIERPGMEPRATADIRADDLIGTRVYGANDEHVGDVGDLVLTQDGQVDAVIIDVGGFLGIGTREVAVGLDDLQFMTDADGGYHLYTNMTQEQLEAQPEYDEATYAERRDNMRMRITE